MIDPYATHLAPLVTAALESNGPILELGCGDYSTPVLAAISRHKGVPFSIMTGNADWGNKFAGSFNVVFVSNWNEVEFPLEHGLIFLDNEQNTQDRIRLLPKLSGAARSVVLHDLEACESHPHWKEMIGPFTSIRRHTTYFPGTGVLTC